MDIISQVAEAMQNILTTVSDTAGRTCGFIKRKRKLTGAKFVQMLVFGWLASPEATYDELSQTAATIGVTLTPQAIEKRFTQQAADTLKTVLDASVEQVIAADPQAVAILLRFNGVLVDDSSWIVLPDALAAIWRGCGGNTEDNTQSALKVHLRWDLLTGAFNHLTLTDATTHDSTVACQAETPPGSLRLADLGYFSLDELMAQDDIGAFWLTRVKANCAIFDRDGNRIELATWLNEQQAAEVELAVELGAKTHLPARLFAVQVTEEVANRRLRQLRKRAKDKGKTPSKARLRLAKWNILATNAPIEKLTMAEAMVLAKVRWQIELMFKLWKSHGHLDSSRSEKPWRVLCEVYAKLIAMIIQHWILLTSSWQFPNRSLVKASKTVSKHALHLAAALAKAQIQPLVEALTTIARCLTVGCRIYRRKAQPATYQLLLELTDESEQLA